MGKRQDGNSGVAQRWCELRGLMCGLIMLNLACASWMLGGFWWVADLVGSMAAQIGGVVLLLAGALGWKKKRNVAMLMVLSTGLAWGGLGWPRATWGAIAEDERVRVLIFNGHSAALGDSEGAFRMLVDSACDVFVLVEPSTELVQRIRAAPEFALWSMYIPEQARAGWRVVGTRWSQRGGEDWSGGARGALCDGVHMMIVDRPSGAFGLVQFHPQSPKTPSRWRAGNMLTQRVADEVRRRLQPLGIPLLAGGDLNATPSSWRSRVFAGTTGMRRAKAAWVIDGSWPSWAPAPLRLAIDDLFVSTGVRVDSWRTIGSYGSDHCAVLIDLGVPTS